MRQRDAHYHKRSHKAVNLPQSSRSVERSGRRLPPSPPPAKPCCCVTNTAAMMTMRAATSAEKGSAPGWRTCGIEGGCGLAGSVRAQHHTEHVSSLEATFSGTASTLHYLSQQGPQQRCKARRAVAAHTVAPAPRPRCRRATPAARLCSRQS